MSLFRGSSLGTHCSGGSCLPEFALEAGALERGLTASFVVLREMKCAVGLIPQTSCIWWTLWLSL